MGRRGCGELGMCLWWARGACLVHMDRAGAIWQNAGSFGSQGSSVRMRRGQFGVDVQDARDADGDAVHAVASQYISMQQAWRVGLCELQNLQMPLGCRCCLLPEEAIHSSSCDGHSTLLFTAFLSIHNMEKSRMKRKFAW